MSAQKIRRTLALLTLVALLPVSAWAFSGPGNANGPRSGAWPPGPPPQAYAACSGKAAGAQVHFTTRRGETLTATCRTMGGKLVAVPDRSRRQGRRMPPPQAFALCSGKTAGARVTITTRRGNTLAATCREVDGKLAAIPARPPRCRALWNGAAPKP